MSDSETLWTLQAPQSMRFSRQEYWRGLPCPPQGDLPDPEIEPMSLVSPAMGGRFFTTSTTLESLDSSRIVQKVSISLQITVSTLRSLHLKELQETFVHKMCEDHCSTQVFVGVGEQLGHQIREKLCPAWGPQPRSTQVLIGREEPAASSLPGIKVANSSKVP